MAPQEALPVHGVGRPSPLAVSAGLISGDRAQIRRHNDAGPGSAALPGPADLVSRGGEAASPSPFRRPPYFAAAPRAAPAATSAASSGATFSILTAHTLNSAVLVTGSPAELVSSLTGDSL